MTKKITLKNAQKYLISRQEFHKLKGAELDAFCNSLVSLNLITEQLDYFGFPESEMITWVYNGFLIHNYFTKEGTARITFPTKQIYKAYKDDFSSYLIYCLNQGEYANAYNVFLQLMYQSASGSSVPGDHISL
jgi:hypothetical protein